MDTKIMRKWHFYGKVKKLRNNNLVKHLMYKYERKYVMWLLILSFTENSLRFIISTCKYTFWSIVLINIYPYFEKHSSLSVEGIRSWRCELNFLINSYNCNKQRTNLWPISIVLFCDTHRIHICRGYFILNEVGRIHKYVCFSKNINNFTQKHRLLVYR